MAIATGRWSYRLQVDLGKLIIVLGGIPEGLSLKVILPDGMTLKAISNFPHLGIEAVGTVHFVAEIGEQLAWLGAAFRSSPYTFGISYCTPSIIEMTTGPVLEISLRNSASPCQTHWPTMALQKERAGNLCFKIPLLSQAIQYPRDPSQTRGWGCLSTLWQHWRKRL